MDEPRWLDEREGRAWRNFLAIGGMLDRLVEQQLKEDAGLTHAQYAVLVWLSEAPGGEVRMTELAGRAVISKSGLTYQVGQLEKAGLVRRRSCESDVRGIIAALTDAGWAKLRETAPGHAARVREVFVDGLDHDRFANLADSLEVLAAHLRAVGGSSTRSGGSNSN
jgi:DNA-binding MarR family transcriptional regulator